MSHQETPEASHELDAWHQHGSAAVPKEEIGAHINIRFLLIFYVVMVVFILVTVGALILFFGYTTTKLSETLVENTYEYKTEFMPYATEAKGRLAEYAWMNREEETVRVPWEVAARSVVANYGGPASDAEELND